VGPLEDVQVRERGVSGRVVRLRLVDARGAREVRGELEVRRLLAPVAGGLLRSALVAIDLERDHAGRVTRLHIAGAGHGHGIGMCQSGAEGMALAGRRYRDILEHYYQKAEVRKLY
jgi:SpoIID/LytB domain protein